MLKIPGSLLNVTHTDNVVLFLIPYTLIFMIGIVKDIADHASYHLTDSVSWCAVLTSEDFLGRRCGQKQNP